MSPQQTIAHYRITAKLGEGGMGEVWRATDTKLSRDVALKILPEAFAHDSDRMARFTREAHVLASLNHTNIAAIYGVEERALVMELVDGPTLAERISQGPAPLNEVLPIARQIAGALDYAHEKGIVHRDLKPANIKLDADGRVKILDFGLAKAISGEPAFVNASNSPTLTMQATVAGVILGTAAYMAPEQAKGKPVDKRADIWAYGVVLYEMLTGRQLFGGESVSDSLAAVLTREPDYERVPPQMQKLLRRCLEKDPKRRLRDLGDASLLMDEEATAPQIDSRRHSKAWIGIAAALAIALAAAAAGWWRASRPVSRPLLRFSADLRSDSMPGSLTPAVLSPDGTRMVFPSIDAEGVQRLSLRLLNQSNAAVLPDTEGATNAFFSPDGQWIGFWTKGKLRRIAVNGGAAITMCEQADARGDSWGDDGTIIMGTRARGLFRVQASGGTPQPLTNPAQKGERSHQTPQVLPGGDAVLFTATTTAISDAFYDDAQIDVLSLKTGQWKTVLRGGYFGRYVPSGHLVYIHDGILLGVPFDLKRLEIRGTPAPLLEDVAANPLNGAGEFDFSNSGIFVYKPGKSSGEIRTIDWLDRAGKVEPLLATPNTYSDPHLSPDGKLLAFATGEKRDVFIYDISRQTTTKLTFTGHNRQPVWAPDGQHIVFDSTSTAALWWARADGAGEPVKLLESKETLIPYSFSPDGRMLAYTAVSGINGAGDLWILPLDIRDPERPVPGKPELFLGTPASEVSPAFSPDGRWIAYEYSENVNRYELYVRPFRAQGSSPGGKWLVSAGRNVRSHVWSRDGRELIYSTMDGHILVVPYRVQRDAFVPEKPQPWPGLRMAPGIAFSNFDIAPDGKRLVIFPDQEGPDSAKGVHVTVLVNFLDELKRRLP